MVKRNIPTVGLKLKKKTSLIYNVCILHSRLYTFPKLVIDLYPKLKFFRRIKIN